MAIRSSNRGSENSFDGITISSEIVVLGGNTRQIFSPIPSPGTYEDDRRFTPCILGGYVSCIDPAGLMNGELVIEDIEWYTQAPKENDYATGRISNPATIPADASQYREIDYLVSDGSGAAWCAGVPKNCLIVHKNIAAGSGETIYGVLKFIDQRTGYPVRKLESIDLSTSGFDNEAVSLRGPDTPEMVIDALALPDSVPAGKTIIDIPWKRSIDVQLVGAEGDVDDAEACYLWTVPGTDGEYRELSEVEKTYLQISGEKTKVLTFDARMITGTLALRCYACRRNGTDWSSPQGQSDAPFWDCRVTQDLNHRITADPVQKEGTAQDTALASPFSYVMDIRYNGKPIPERMKCLFRVKWYATGLTTVSGSKRYEKNFLGTSPNIRFIPSAYGYTYRDGFLVHGEVLTFRGCTAVIDGSKYLKSGDAFVISPDFE